MRVGIVGTGAIANKHAEAYRNIGYRVAACTDLFFDKAEEFAAKTGAQAVRTVEEVCSHPDVDFVDLCTFPDVRLDPVRLCARNGKSIQVQKPVACTSEVAREMIAVAKEAGITLGVVSQHRFDDATRFLKAAIANDRLGTILQADAYVKWWRSAEYYSRPIKGSWQTEGGGALINQGIHQADILQYLIGPVSEVFGYWQLGALHKIESEDVICAVMRYQSGATGVFQASTAFWPGYTERIELHGTKGTAIISGDRLTAWDVKDDAGDPAPVQTDVASGSSDPMAISLEPFERQFLDFGEAVKNRTRPLSAGEDGLQALDLVTTIYDSCRANDKRMVAGA